MSLALFTRRPPITGRRQPIIMRRPRPRAGTGVTNAAGTANMMTAGTGVMMIERVALRTLHGDAVNGGWRAVRRVSVEEARPFAA